ncbi:MAG: diphthine synthase [Candidatus Poseidoniia archaeon]
MTEEDLGAGLWLIGLGPGDLGQMTRGALVLSQACNYRFLEGYTAVLPIEEENALEGLVGPWGRLMRDEVEKPEKILDLAQHSSVALLVVGDPMQATTHIDLEERCAELNIPFKVIPGLSATSLAISLSGLQSYRFGRQVTLTYSYGDYLPTSPLELIDKNYNNNLHTLMLLDLDPTGMGIEKPKPMAPKVAVELLQRMIEKISERDGGLKPSLQIPIVDWDGILLSDISTNQQRIEAGNLGKLSNYQGGNIHSFILPAKMTDEEKKAFTRRMRK